MNEKIHTEERLKLPSLPRKKPFVYTQQIFIHKTATNFNEIFSRTIKQLRYKRREYSQTFHCFKLRKRFSFLQSLFVLRVLFFVRAIGKLFVDENRKIKTTETFSGCTVAVLEFVFDATKSTKQIKLDYTWQLTLLDIQWKRKTIDNQCNALHANHCG